MGQDSRLKSWTISLNSTLLGIRVGAEVGQEGDITKGNRRTLGVKRITLF